MFLKYLILPLIKFLRKSIKYQNEIVRSKASFWLMATKAMSSHYIPKRSQEHYFTSSILVREVSKGAGLQFWWRGKCWLDANQRKT